MRHLLIAFLLLIATPAWAATYYVTPTGNDTTGDGSVGAPWATLSKACNTAPAGNSTTPTIISVAAGSYTDNTTCTRKLFTNIVGAGAGTTSITTSANPYINGSTTAPVVDGGGEISGLAITGSGTNVVINSTGRNNAKVYNCTITNGNITLYGKPPTFYASGSGHPSASWDDADPTTSTPPLLTDWATGVQVYSNTFTNCNLKPGCLKGALIHDNTWNNTTKSCLGNTSYYFDSSQVYNNTFTMTAISASSIAIEIWQNSGGTRYYNNTTNGWFSILANTNGSTSPWSWEIDHNTFTSNISGATINYALESGYFARNVAIHDNYFTNSGANLTYKTAWGFHGRGTSDNIRFHNNVIYNLNSDDITLSTTNATAPAMAATNIHIYNNVIDAGTTSGHQAIYMDGSGPGTISGVYIKNNAIMGRLHGALTIGTAISSINFGYNLGASPNNTVSGSGFASSANNIDATPGFTGSGSRPAEWYAPVSGGNLIDAGVGVGLEYTGSAPEIGAYEVPAVAPAINIYKVTASGLASVSSNANIAAHVNDPTAAHAASAVSFTPAGSIAATTVKGALEELDGEKASLAHNAINFLAVGGVADSNGTHLNGTDNEAALESAIQLAASTGRALYIPAGIYRTSPISVTWADSSVLKLKIYGEGHIFIDDDSEGVIGFYLRGQTTPPYKGKVTVSGLTFTRYNTGVRRANSLGIMIKQFDMLYFTDNDVSGFSYIAFMPQYLNRTIIANNRVHDSVIAPNQDGISLSAVDRSIITNNSIWNTCDDSIAVAHGGTGNYYDTVVDGNTIGRETNWALYTTCSGSAVKIVGGVQNAVVSNNLVRAENAHGYIQVYFESYNTGDAKNINITGNTLVAGSTFNYDYGINVVNESTTSTVDTVKISENLLVGNGIAVGGGGPGGGVSTSYSQVIKNLVINDNLVVSAPKHSISAKYADTLAIKDNDLFYSGNSGIDVNYAKTLLGVWGNTVYDHSVLSAGYAGINIQNVDPGAAFYENSNRVVSVTAGGGPTKTISATPITEVLTASVTGAAGSLAAQYIDWQASSGGNSIANKPNIPVASDTAYDAGSWDGNSDVPTKNAVRDKIEAIAAGGGGSSISAGDSSLNVTDGGDGIFTVVEDGSEVARVTGGKLGLNTTAPAKTLEVNAATGGAVRLIHNDSDGTPANYCDFTVNSAGTGSLMGSSTGQYNVAVSRAQNAALDSAARYTVFNVNNTNSIASPLAGSSLTALEATQFYSGTGTMPSLYGAYYSARNTGSGVVTDLSGMYIDMRNSTTTGGDVTTMSGVQIQAAINGTGGDGAVIGSSNGVYVRNQGASGITTSAGLRISAQSGATNSYAIITEGAGNVGIGTTAPSTKLSVSGGISGQTYAVNKSADATLTAEEVSNTIVSNFGATALVTATLPAAAAGYSFIATVSAAYELRLDPNASDTIYLNDASLSAADGKYLSLGSTIGNQVVCYTAITGAGPAYDWFCRDIRGFATKEP